MDILWDRSLPEARAKVLTTGKASRDRPDGSNPSNQT